MSKVVHDAIAEQYGCAPDLREARYCTECAERKGAMQKRRDDERASVRELNALGAPKTYLLANTWVQKWSAFIDNRTLKLTGRGTWIGCPPPDKVDNSSLLEKDGETPRKNKTRGKDYVVVNEKLWAFFAQTYGVSTRVLFSSTQDLYSLETAPAIGFTEEEGDVPPEVHPPSQESSEPEKKIETAASPE